MSTHGPGQSGVAVWLVDLDQLERALERLQQSVGILSDDEVAWAHRTSAQIEANGSHADTRTTRAQARRRTCRLALRVLLAAAGEPAALRTALVCNAAGKPRLANGRTGFSVSHTQDHALLALSASADIGVDLERQRPVDFEPRRARLIVAAGRALASSAGGMASVPPPAQFGIIEAWTTLEAVGKARGTGVGRLLTELGITAAGAAALSEAEVADRARYLLGETGIAVQSLRLPHGLVGALATPIDVAAAPTPLEMLDEADCVFPPAALLIERVEAHLSNASPSR